MQTSKVLTDTVKTGIINYDQALHAYHNASLAELIYFANSVRRKIHNNKFVSFIIDRNINYTNICYSKCLFCSFYRQGESKDAYLMSSEDYIPKIDELYAAGGKQILLQGGMNKKTDIQYFVNLFEFLKSKYPDIKLHALSPSEIVFLAKKAKMSFKDVLVILRNAGLDSLPGGGAEILSDRVRKLISPAKCSVSEWLEVMKKAHQLGITSSATMMFGHLETIEERIEHLFLLKDLQNNKPINSMGFISFTVWPLAAENTELVKLYPNIKPVYAEEYIRTLAISRIILNNIPNIQASWLSVGKELAGVCLNAGANDLSSIMIEENVLSSSGMNNRMNRADMEKLIRNSCFEPKLRNQEYEYLNE
jgi:cyclic dehypoxanthinyl futalosine synthase